MGRLEEQMGGAGGRFGYGGRIAPPTGSRCGFSGLNSQSVTAGRAEVKAIARLEA